MQVLVTIMPPLITLILGAVSSYLVATKQAEKNLRHKQRIDYLLSAYRTIEGVMSRSRNLTPEEKKALETAVADVNLLGNVEQQETMRRALQEMAASNHGAFGEVLNSLRRELRKYLGLEPGLEEVSYFRLP